MGSSTIRLTSLNAGMPRALTAADGSTYTSGIDKKPLSEPVQITAEGIVGDGSAYHGHAGPNMRVNVFAEEKYEVLERLAGCTLPRPAFGENFTLAGLPDNEARIGDILRAGSAVLQVSQPRGPCGTLIRFLGIPKIVCQMSDNNATGYYLRVLEPGEVGPGEELELVDRGDQEWTIERLNTLIHREPGNHTVVEAALTLPLLSEDWKKGLRERAEKARAKN
ncbi:MOSC domain-containing protein [bacterium]|nr:MOSC domain-containing protein [bacterium]